MAEWNPSTSYGPGAAVTYLGLPYVRSAYPIGATSGTNPKEEMGVDPKGDPIRTWELRVPSYGYTRPYHVGYLSLLAPARSDGTYIKEPPLEVYPGKLAPQNPYAGATDVQMSAYGFTAPLLSEILGESIDMDQARAAIPPTIDPPFPGLPSAPVMPANKCGLLYQQFQEISSPDPIPTEPYISSSNGYGNTAVLVYENLVYDPVTEQWIQDASVRPRVYYAFLFFNHPLFFRRQHTITFRISTLTYTGGYAIPDSDPPIVVPPTSEGVYSSYPQTVTPTDGNYWTSASNLTDWINPANAVATYTLPNDETYPGPYDSVDGVNYQMVEVFVSDVESND
jgi:hypothetical protein